MKKDNKSPKPLNESVVKSWGKIAGIQEVQANFLNERYYERDMDQPGMVEEAEEEEMALEPEVGDEIDMGSDEVSVGDEMPADEMSAEESGSVDMPEADVAKIVDAVAQAIEQITNVDVDVEADVAEEPEMDVSAEMPAEMPEDEPEEDLMEGEALEEAESLANKGGNSEDPFKGNDNGGAQLKKEGAELEEAESLEEEADKDKDDKKELDEMTDALTEMVLKKIVKRFNEIKKSKKDK